MEDDKYKDFIENATLNQIYMLVAKLEFVQDPEIKCFVKSLKEITG